jgi:hypothetical protein
MIIGMSATMVAWWMTDREWPEEVSCMPMGAITMNSLRW